MELQRTIGNHAVARLLARGRAGSYHDPGSPVAVQRHSDSALLSQVSPLEDDALLQRTIDGGSVQRHPIQPPVESLQPARMPFRKIEQAKRVFGDGNTQEDIRQSLRHLARANLSDSEYAARRKLIDELKWNIDASENPNPAQAGADGITIFVKHENYYFPDGSIRIEFIKSVMLHEALHVTSLHSTGFQGPDSFTKGLASDSLDEAVTDKLGSELASDVLGQGEKYTSQYWNVLGRKGLDYHVTSRGLEKLTHARPNVWLGELVDIITAVTKIGWPQLKKAYLTNEQGLHDTVQQAVESKRADIEAQWKARRESALEATLGPDAIPGSRWEQILTGAVQSVDAKAGAKTAYSADAVKALIDAELLTATNAEHQVVPKADRRSSSKDDWAIVNRVAKAGQNIKPAALWKPAGSGMSPSKAATTAGDLAAQQATAARPQHVQEVSSSLWSTIGALERHVKTATRMLGMPKAAPPLSWVLIPKPEKAEDPNQHKVGDRLETYVSSRSTALLDAANKSESIASLTGENPTKKAHETVAGYGGAGYEVNGHIGFVTQEHTNLGTVVHEMGHHKQAFEGLHEDSVGAVPKLLDFHNIVSNENKLAADDIRSGRDADPYVRLRYTSGPTRLRVSEWRAFAEAKADKEGDAYVAFRDRLVKRGGAYAKLIGEIEAGLQDASLYPGKVGILFKNFMIEEIKASKGDVSFSDVS